MTNASSADTPGPAFVYVVRRYGGEYEDFYELTEGIFSTFAAAVFHIERACGAVRQRDRYIDARGLRVWRKWSVEPYVPGMDSDEDAACDVVFVPTDCENFEIDRFILDEGAPMCLARPLLATRAPAATKGERG